MLGRFLSADLAVQFPNDLQSYNRYSYVQNNPLKYVDPTGFALTEVIKYDKPYVDANGKTVLGAPRRYLTTDHANPNGTGQGPTRGCINETHSAPSAAPKEGSTGTQNDAPQSAPARFGQAAKDISRGVQAVVSVVDEGLNTTGDPIKAAQDGHRAVGQGLEAGAQIGGTVELGIAGVSPQAAMVAAGAQANEAAQNAANHPVETVVDLGIKVLPEGAVKTVIDTTKTVVDTAKKTTDTLNTVKDTANAATDYNNAQQEQKTQNNPPPPPPPPQPTTTIPPTH